ncbi:hypothetical protein CBS9595_003064 [Malassezia furfur]|nr:hypothetical protein CBS9595_003064 [Malassezia furfur]
MCPVRTQSTVAQNGAQPTHTATTHYRVTLRRSAIGLPKQTSRVLESLGLHKRLQSVYQPQNPATAGAILAVKELVHVENVRALSPEVAESLDPSATVWVNAKGEVVDAGRVAYKAPKGFRVVGNLINEERDADVKRSLSEKEI